MAAWLRWTVLIAGLLAVVALFAMPQLPRARWARTRSSRARWSRLAYLPLVFALVAGLAGPLAYSLDTVNTTYTGALPSAGPQLAGAFGGPGGPRAGLGGGGFGGLRGGGLQGGGLQGGSSSGTGTGAGGATGTGGGTGTGGLQGGPGGDAVMAIGGFNGTDPAPTLAEFEAMVAKHEIHYYVGRGANSFGGGGGSSAIAAWVAAHFTGKTVGGVTVYDLTQQK